MKYSKLIYLGGGILFLYFLGWGEVVKWMKAAWGIASIKTEVVALPIIINIIWLMIVITKWFLFNSTFFFFFYYYYYYFN